jgi:Polyketide cyclase / dehydrase and lipid transport
MSSGKPVRVDVAHPFAVGLRDGYDYITDLGNWHAYWPDLVRIDPHSRWSAPGDRTRIVLRLLGRETEMTMVLARMEPYRLVEYMSEQSGLPAARHERHFADDGEGGLAYRAVVEYLPRDGLRGLFDRVIVRRALERAVRTTVANLDARFAAGDLRPAEARNPSRDPCPRPRRRARARSAAQAAGTGAAGSPAAGDAQGQGRARGRRASRATGSAHRRRWSSLYADGRPWLMRAVQDEVSRSGSAPGAGRDERRRRAVINQERESRATPRSSL